MKKVKMTLVVAASFATIMFESNGQSQNNNGCYFREEPSMLIFGNTDVEFMFDKNRGGALIGITDKTKPDLKFNNSNTKLCGEWTLEFGNAPLLSTSEAQYWKNEYLPGKEHSSIRIFTRTDKAELVQEYTIKPRGTMLICKGIWKNLSDQKILLNTYTYSLGNLAIGGNANDNKFIYPPHVFNFLKGNIKDATPAYMKNHYIYGNMQSTDKLMLPYAMIYHDFLKQCVTVAGVNSKAKVYVGIYGGDSGIMNSSFHIFREIPPGESENIGTVYLALYQSDWKSGMRAEKQMLMGETGYHAPAGIPEFTKDMVILWDGFPGVGINNFDDLSKILPEYKARGINTLIVGGRIWYCYFDQKPESGCEGFIPLPQNGKIIPSTLSGGEEGLKRLIAKAHSLNMKICVWGPTSMAGIDRHSAEAKSQPDWWVYKKDGTFNDWYSFMVPANPASPGWRNFYVDNVRRVVKDYGVDGIWLDSTWQDQALNYKDKNGWYGSPNGEKNSLVEEIVNAAKMVNPDCMVMAEGGGIEVMRHVDLAYIGAHGIWPAIKPEDVQMLIENQELNRLPGIRPFGQLELGLGFYPELGEPSRKLSEKYQGSWLAKTFLVSTLDRVPVYFGLNWGLGAIITEGQAVTVTKEMENNPEFLKSVSEKETFRKWSEVLKKINQVRAENPELKEGETDFTGLELANPAIVHYWRKLHDRTSLVLLNADLVPHSFNFKVVNPAILGILPDKTYYIKNLMTNKYLLNSNYTEQWQGIDILQGKPTLSLDGYEGAVLKIIIKP